MDIFIFYINQKIIIDYLCVVDNGITVFKNEKCTNNILWIYIKIVCVHHDPQSYRYYNDLDDSQYYTCIVHYSYKLKL